MPLRPTCLSPWTLCLALALAAGAPGLARSGGGAARPGGELTADTPPALSQAPIIEVIELRGTLRTREGVVRGLLDVAPGQPVDEGALARSRRRLFATGLFHSVRMRLARGEAPGRVRLIVELEERPTLTLSRLTLGSTAVSPAYAGLGLTDLNLFGGGQLASAAVVVGADQRWGARASLHEPDLFGEGLLFGGTLTWVRGVELQCPLGLAACDFREFDRHRYRRAGGILTLGLAPEGRARVFLSARAESLRGATELGLIRLRGEAPRPLSVPSLPAEQTLLTTLALAVEHDSRDDPFLASRGRHLRASVEVSSALFFSDFNYSRYTLSAAQHLRLGPSSGLRLHGFLGLIQGPAPFFERFSPSDYSHFSLGPNTVPRELEISFSEAPRYQDVLFNGGARYHLLFHQGSPDGFVYRAAFFVSGALTLSADDVGRSLFDFSHDPSVEPGRFPLSADAGIELDTVIGVFSLGLSYPLDVLF